MAGLADLDTFELNMLAELEARPYPRDRVNPVLFTKLRTLKLAELEDRKPGKPAFTKGKWFVVVTDAGRAVLSERKAAASLEPDPR
jgi:hypothetical protein